MSKELGAEPSPLLCSNDAPPNGSPAPTPSERAPPAIVDLRIGGGREAAGGEEPSPPPPSLWLLPCWAPSRKKVTAPPLPPLTLVFC